MNDKPLKSLSNHPVHMKLQKDVTEKEVNDYLFHLVTEGLHNNIFPAYCRKIIGVFEKRPELIDKYKHAILWIFSNDETQRNWQSSSPIPYKMNNNGIFTHNDVYGENAYEIAQITRKKLHKLAIYVEDNQLFTSD